MRVVFILLAVLIVTPASAQSCAQVRQAVAVHGYARAAAWARINLTPEQQRAALACLRRPVNRLARRR